MSVLKVGILDPLGRHGGFHYYTEGLANGLSKLGVEAVVYGFEVPPGSASPNNVSAFENIYGTDPAWVRGLRYMRGVFISVLDAKRRGLKLLHIHCFHYDVRELIASLATRLAGIRLVATLHDVESFGSRRGHVGRSLILSLANGLILQNNYSKNVLLNGGGALRIPVAVVPHPHYVDQYKRQPTRQAARCALGLDANKLIILFFGNPRPEKGLDVTLDALARWGRDDVLLLVAGKIREDDLGGLNELQHGSLSGRLRIDAGRVSDADAEQYYRAADVVIVPYHRVYESGVAIMAMSFSRCVVYSDLDPLIESVGEAGLSFKVGDADDLVRCLSDVLVADRDALGALGRERVEISRGSDRVARETLALYGHLTG